MSELTGFEVRLKAEMFQRVGSYKIRGPLNKFALMPDDQKARERAVRRGSGWGKTAVKV